MNEQPVSLAKLFPGFETELIYALEQNATIQQYHAGEKVIRQGQYFRSALIVVEGLVKISREGEDGNEFFMYYLEPGQACALSMVCASRQDTSEVIAVAVKDTWILVIPLDLIDKWALQFKSWNRFVMASYRARFEELLVTLDHVAFRNMDQRLEFYLKRQEEKFGKHLQLTHQQIAEDLNSSREVISRLLKSMEKNRHLILHRSGIEMIHL